MKYKEFKKSKLPAGVEQIDPLELSRAMGLSDVDHYEMEYEVGVATALINARLGRGMTQVQLAEKMGTFQPAIARAENGDAPSPSHSFLKRAARALNAKIVAPKIELL